MNAEERTVAICLATYNGARYIKEQIFSIIKQQYTNWMLFIRDDGSSDNTVEIVKAFIREYGDRIVLIEDCLDCGSSKKNFAAILAWVKKNYQFPYYMFCDQDDVWEKDKIQVSMEKMIEEERKHEVVLVHTDLQVVDAELNNLGESFFSYQALNPKEYRLNRLMVQNNVTGCTMLWNKALNDLIDLDEETVIMHDWWIALAAAAFGKIACVEKPTMKYRQHGKNVVGASKVNSMGFIIKRLRSSAQVRESLQQTVAQAGAFLRCYDKRLTREQAEMVSTYASLYDHGKVERMLILWRGKYLKQGFGRRIGQFLYI